MTWGQLVVIGGGYWWFLVIFLVVFVVLECFDKTNSHFTLHVIYLFNQGD